MIIYSGAFDALPLSVIFQQLNPFLFLLLKNCQFYFEVHTWSVDANQFIADEEDATYSCRFSGQYPLKILFASLSF